MLILSGCGQKGDLILDSMYKEIDISYKDLSSII